MRLCRLMYHTVTNINCKLNIAQHIKSSVILLKRPLFIMHIPNFSQRFSLLKRSIKESLDGVPGGFLSYQGIVKVGTPAQIYDVMFDTGSCNFWIEKFNNVQSDTFVALGIQANPILYGDGSSVDGVLVRDTVSIGEVVVPNLTFESATTVRGWTTPTTDGLMGLCYTRSTGDPVDFVETAAQRKKIESRLITMSISSDQSATITFGTIDQSAYVGDITYLPVTEGSTYWQSTLNRVSGSGISWSQSIPAIFDTGTSVLVTPLSLLNSLANALGFTEMSTANQLYARSCTTLPTSNQTLSFAFAGVTLNVPLSSLITQYGNMCYLAVMQGSEEMVIVGNSVLKSFYTIFDEDNGRVGFAQTNGTFASIDPNSISQSTKGLQGNPSAIAIWIFIGLGASVVAMLGIALARWALRKC